MQFALMLYAELHCLTIHPTGSGKTHPVVLYAQWSQMNLNCSQGHTIILIPYILLYGQMNWVMEEASVSFVKWDAEN